MMKRTDLLRAIVISLMTTAGCAVVITTTPASAQATAPSKQGWYGKLATYDEVRANVEIPPKKGVSIIDARPTARRYDVGHIPGAINIPDSSFDKLAGQLPADKGSLLIFYCNGVDCILSHNSAFKAEKLGYTNIKVYAEGMPEWEAKGGQVAVSAARIMKLINGKADYLLIDARPQRLAAKGTIPTAVNIPNTDFEKSVDKLPADKAKPLIYFCNGLECPLSDKSAVKAKALGYKNVFTYPEGYPEWEKLYGTTVDKAAAKNAATPLTPTAKVALAPGKEKGTVTPESFSAALKNSPSAILVADVRDPKEFAAGSIAGAVNLPINDLQRKIDTLPKDKPVVFVCGTGARAGEAYDMVTLLSKDIQAYFVDARVKFLGNGTFTIEAAK